MHLHIQNATINIPSNPNLASELLSLQVRGEVGAFQPADAVATISKGERVIAAAALAPPNLGEIWPGQGGIYVGTVPAMLGLPARHLVVSTAEACLCFGPYEEIDGTGSHVDGAANTKALLAHGDEHPAAKWASEYTADGNRDFHLPSRLDLLMAYLQAPQAFEKDGWYWSSTQDSRDYAFVQYFALGSSTWIGKGHEFRVRAVRWIQL